MEQFSNQRLKVMGRNLVPKSMSSRGVIRERIPLNRGRVSAVFNVFGGPVVVHTMFLEITTALPAGTNNMTWVFRSATGGYRVIGAAVDICPSALGDFYWAELDGTNIVQATTGTGLIFNGAFRKDANGQGVILTQGQIDIALSDNTISAGQGRMTIYYQPLVFGAGIAAEDWGTSTTSSSSTSSTSSSTSSTSTTSSTTSTTSSTSSTASTTSSTSSTSSTASTTSSTSSTASTTSTSSSTTSTTTTGP